ncbi:MAG: DUF58 domain-containing protein [Chitinophagaceae bacterium]
MWKRKNDSAAGYPPEVVTTLDDLMRFEWLVQSTALLPSHPVYSLLVGRHASKLRGRGLDFEEVRQYVPGDDIRNIDWLVTARTGKTHSKVFNEEKERPTFIVLDQSSWMFFGSQRYVKSVTAAQVAALSAFYTLKRGDRTGGIIFNEDGFDHISPRRSKGLLQYYLQCVVKRNELLPLRKTVYPNTNLLNRMLKQTASSVTHDYVIAVISDFSMIDEETKERLKIMSYHNDVILVHIYDAWDETLPDGKLVLTDGKHQVAWNNKKHHWGEDYHTAFTKMREQLTAEFMHTGIPIVFYNTTEPVEDQVSYHMGKITKRRKI